MLLKKKEIANKKKKITRDLCSYPVLPQQMRVLRLYSLGGARNKELMDRYLGAVLAHIREAAPSAIGYEVDTVYFGGGTPSFFGASGLDRILPRSTGASTSAATRR